MLFKWCAPSGPIEFATSANCPVSDLTRSAMRSLNHSPVHDNRCRDSSAQVEIKPRVDSGERSRRCLGERGRLDVIADNNERDAKPVDKAIAQGEFRPTVHIGANSIRWSC